MKKNIRSLFLRNLPKVYPAVLACSLMLLSACEKFTEVSPPPTLLASSAVFQSESTAQAALNSLYINSMTYTAGSFNSVAVLGSLSADEMENYSTNLAIQQVAGAQLIPSNSYSTSLWSTCYGNIYYANAILEACRNNSYLSSATLAQLQGEALFFRALGHLTLASFFGKVPLIHSTNYRANTLTPQLEYNAVLDAVIADLQQAIPQLTGDYALAAGERIRANRYVAKALLARAQLYRGQYAEAVLTAGEVIENPLFGLGTLAETFLKNSKETILAIKPTTAGHNTGEGNVFLLTAKPTFLAMRTGFYQGFETGDQRRTAWTSKVTSGGIDYYFPFKYRSKITTATSEYSVIIRLAEMYLIRAEAKARLDQLPGAISDVDMVRHRAGLPKLALTNPNIAQTALLEAIFNERKSELFTEWAHRWIDLKRFGKHVAVLTPIKAGYQATAGLYPIPQSELNINHQLVQNPGY